MRIERPPARPEDETDATPGVPGHPALAGAGFARTLGLLIACAAVVLIIGGCSRTNRVDEGTRRLKKTFPEAVRVQHRVGEEASPINAFVGAALAAVQTNDYAAGVAVLDNVANTARVTADQLMAVQQARQVLIVDLVERAAHGDAAAKAALATLERTRSQ